MELGKISQLEAYENGLKRASNTGNCKNVKTLAEQIVIVAKEKREESFDMLDCIDEKPFLRKEDNKNIETCEGNIFIYDDWIKKYSPNSPVYRNYLSMASSNSWKQSDRLNS